MLSIAQKRNQLKYNQIQVSCSDSEDNISMDDKNCDIDCGEEPDGCATSNNSDQNSDDDENIETFTDENEE